MQHGRVGILALALTASTLVFALAGCSSSSSSGPGQTGNTRGGGTMMNRGSTTNPNGSGRGSMMTTSGTNP
jgi:hypothetical protein